MERDPATDKQKAKLEISTHTLTWSVTMPIEQQNAVMRISTHTLTWSVTK